LRRLKCTLYIFLFDARLGPYENLIVLYTEKVFFI
jgi:hypothetical protein